MIATSGKSGLNALKAMEREIEKDPGAFARTVCELREVFTPFCEKALRDALIEVKKKVDSRSALCNFLFCLGDIFAFIGVIECFETENFLGTILDIIACDVIDIKSRRCAETILLAFIEHDSTVVHQLLSPLNFHKVLAINAAISSRKFGCFTLQEFWVEFITRMKALLSKTKKTTALKNLNQSLPSHFFPKFHTITVANFSNRIRSFLMAVNVKNPFVKSYNVKDIFSELYWETPTDEIRIGEVHWLDLGIEAISFKVEIPASIEENKDNDNQIEAIDFCIAYEQMKDVSFMKRGMSVRFNYVCGENFSPYHAAILKVPKGIHPRLRIFIRGNPSTLRDLHQKWLELQSQGHIDCEEEETPDPTELEGSPPDNGNFRKCSVVCTRGHPLQSLPQNVDKVEQNGPLEVDEPLKWQPEADGKVFVDEISKKPGLANAVALETRKKTSEITKTQKLLDLALKVCSEVPLGGKKGEMDEKPNGDKEKRESSAKTISSDANGEKKFYNTRSERRYTTRGVAKNGGLGQEENTQKNKKVNASKPSPNCQEDVFLFEEDQAANKTKKVQQVKPAYSASNTKDAKQKADSLAAKAQEKTRKPSFGKLELVTIDDARKSSGKLELVVATKANTKSDLIGQKGTPLTQKNLKALDEYVEAIEGRDSPLSRLSPPDWSRYQNGMRTTGSSGFREDDGKMTDERILKNSQKESRPAVPREISTPPPCRRDDADQENKGRVSRSMSGLKEKNVYKKKEFQGYHTDTDDDHDTEDQEIDVVGTLLKLYLKRSQKGEEEQRVSKARSAQVVLCQTMTLTADHMQTQDSILQSLETEIQDCIACLTSTAKNIALKRELLYKDNEDFVSGLKRGRAQFDVIYDKMEKEKRVKRSKKSSLEKEKKMLQSVINLL